MATETITGERNLIKSLKSAGIVAKRWRNTGEFVPPADVNYKGVMRVHTGGQPVEVATDPSKRQAIISPTSGRYKGESFLVGMDETSNFVSRLPQPVATVDEAHEVLRPKHVPVGTKRQGEWFFLPATDCPCGKTIEAHVSEGRSLAVSSGLQGTTHVAELQFSHMGKTFVKGTVADNRNGRHKPVQLDTWHEAAPNTEKQFDREPNRVKVRRFD